MLSRRRFLGYSIAGAVTAVAGCRPDNLGQLTKKSHTNFHKFLEDKTNLASQKKYLLGYPLNMSTPPDQFFAWRNELKRIGISEFGFNNVGNPYVQSSIQYNTHDFERDLIKSFSHSFGFSADDTWGFLSHSGTDSNMHGMYLGRTILKGQTGVAPKCYFTKEAHYSIQILSDLLGFERIFIDTLPDASMDTEDLRQKLSLNRNKPALVVASTGTTFKGAIDHLNKINKVLDGYQHYVHLDAALFGGYLPYTNGVNEVQHTIKTGTLRKRYDSIAVSCHKFFGFPSPAGLFITTKANYTTFSEFYSNIHNPEYIGHVPGTITCSRDAVKPAEFYFFATSPSRVKQAEDAKAILQNTDYLMDQMKTHFAHLNPIRSNSLSNTIYFKKPGNQIVKKYSLATMHLEENGVFEDFAHVVVMPHANRNVLDEFLTDLSEDQIIQFG